MKELVAFASVDEVVEELAVILRSMVGLWVVDGRGRGDVVGVELKDDVVGVELKEDPLLWRRKRGGIGFLSFF